MTEPRPADRPRTVSSLELQSLSVTHRAEIPESYIDVMGHMNIMWYTHLFAHGMGGLFKLIGMDRDYFVSNQAGCFALQQFVCYLAEIRVGEQVTLRTRLLGRSAKRMHLMHFIVKDGGDVLASTAEILAAHVDMRTRRTAPFPESLAQAIDQVIAQHAALGWEPPVCGVMRP
jgi:acyl-CoA thioester hydrolase